jgi:hypothetical protein
METTRRFPRSLSDAFPAARAGSVQGPYRRPAAERIANVLMALALGAGGAGALVLWWST